MKAKGRYYVYVLRLKGGALYTGYTCDVGSRLRRHVAGRASRCTRSFPPVQVVACWEVAGGRGAAMSVERFLKGRDRAGKELLAENPELLERRYAGQTGRSCGARPVSPLPELPPAPPG